MKAWGKSKSINPKCYFIQPENPKNFSINYVNCSLLQAWQKHYAFPWSKIAGMQFFIKPHVLQLFSFYLTILQSSSCF